MPSIFIWKADTPNTSKKTIRFYSGSNWALEDNDYSSKSYIYLEQIVISESDNSVITFKSKDMPQDWVGSELLEVSNVPYEMVKTDNYGVLERIGDWIRFTAKVDVEFTEDNLKKEYNEIKKWINHKSKVMKKEVPQKSQKNNSLDPHKIQIDFQQFLIKYNLPPSQLSSELITSIKPVMQKNHMNKKFDNSNRNKVKPNMVK